MGKFITGGELKDYNVDAILTAGHAVQLVVEMHWIQLCIDVKDAGCQVPTRGLPVEIGSSYALIGKELC